MDALLAVVFVLALPAWLTVEQILVLMRSTEATRLPATEDGVGRQPSRSFTYAEDSLAVTTIDRARVGNG